MDTLSSKLNEIYKAVIDGMEKYLRERGWSSLADATQPEQGRALTEFYVKEIAAYTDNLSDEDAIREGLECDGAGDLTIDFVYKKPDEDEFWICQSKHRGIKSELKSGDFADFFEIHRRILDKSVRKHANDTVKDMLRNFNPKKSVATFVLLTNSKLSPRQRADFDSKRNQLLASDEPWADNFHWELVSLSEIKQKFKQAQSLEEVPPSVDIPIESFGARNFGKQGFIDLSKHLAKSEKDYETIITAIRGTTLCNLWKRYRRSLFNYNIRGFLGKSKNKKIMETLENEPGFFYLYNNGISTTCTDLRITPTGDGATAHCKDFQIINGAQTVSSIGEFADSHGEDNLKKVLVLARITKAERTKSVKGLNKNIITFNNTQNRIQDADFCSNDDIQMFLEKAFQKEGFQYCGEKPFRTLIYMPKRMHRRRKSTEERISLEEMAKSLYAFTKDTPDKLNSQTKFLFDKDDEDGYWSIFGDAEGNKAEMLSESAVRRFAAIIALNCHLKAYAAKLKKAVNTEETPDKKGKHPPLYPSNSKMGMVIRSGRHMLWAFGFAIRTLYAEDADKIYNRILDGKAFADGGFVQQWLDRITHVMTHVMTREEEGGKTLNFKMWLRSNAKVRDLKSELELYQKGMHIGIDGQISAPKSTKGGK